MYNCLTKSLEYLKVDLKKYIFYWVKGFFFQESTFTRNLFLGKQKIFHKILRERDLKFMKIGLHKIYIGVFILKSFKSVYDVEIKRNISTLL